LPGVSERNGSTVTAVVPEPVSEVDRLREENARLLSAVLRLAELLKASERDGEQLRALAETEQGAPVN